MNKSFLILVIAFVICAVLSVAHGAGDHTRVKRGHGGGGGGGMSHRNYIWLHIIFLWCIYNPIIFNSTGHYPGRGGGAAGPVYFCGYVGKGEGSRYGGGYGRR